MGTARSKLNFRGNNTNAANASLAPLIGAYFANRVSNNNNNMSYANYLPEQAYPPQMLSNQAPPLFAESFPNFGQNIFAQTPMPPPPPPAQPPIFFNNDFSAGGPMFPEQSLFANEAAPLHNFSNNFNSFQFSQESALLKPPPQFLNHNFAPVPQHFNAPPPPPPPPAPVASAAPRQYLCNYTGSQHFNLPPQSQLPLRKAPVMQQSPPPPPPPTQHQPPMTNQSHQYSQAPAQPQPQQRQRISSIQVFTKAPNPSQPSYRTNSQQFNNSYGTASRPTTSLQSKTIAAPKTLIPIIKKAAPEYDSLTTLSEFSNHSTNKYC